MYKELEKYKTGKKIPLNAIVHCLDGTKREEIYQADEYQFKFGELLNDFIIHKNRSWFWKFWNGFHRHNELTRIYIKWLNNWGMVSDSWL